MKSLTVSVIAVLISLSASAQSKSYQALKDKFAGSKTVSVHTSGFLARAILRMAGEHQYTHAFRDINRIHITVIPKAAFKARNLTVKGFCKFAKEDSFEEIAFIRERGDDVTVLLQPGVKHEDNIYLVLVDNDDEVVAVEAEGYIDAAQLRDRKIAYQY